MPESLLMVQVSRYYADSRCYDLSGHEATTSERQENAYQGTVKSAMLLMRVMGGSKVVSCRLMCISSLSAAAEPASEPAI